MIAAPKRTRAALYLRLSEENEADRTDSGDSASIGRQRADLIALCEREGWEPVVTYTDDGLSGRKARANAERALADLAAGRVDVLAVYAWDRWSRQGIRAVADLVDALAASGGLFVALREGLRSDMPTWEVIAGVMAWQAKTESENTAARVSRAVRENRRAGRYTGGITPLGYRSAPNPAGPGSVLVVDPAESDALTRAANAIMAGTSVYAVSQALNDSNLKPRRAASWSIQTVRQALTGVAIVGRVRIDGDVLREPDGSPRQVFPPAIPVDLWHNVRAVLAARAAHRPNVGERRRSPRARLLSGLAVCGGCGSPMYVRTNTAGNQSYRCGAVSNGRPCDVGASASVDALDALVTAAVLPIVGPLRLVAPVAAERDTAALADVLEAITATQEAFAAPDADYAALGTRMAALQASKAAMEAEAAAAPKATEFRETGETFGDLWERSDITTRREHLARIVGNVAVRKAERRGNGWGPLEERVTVLWMADSMGEPDYLAGQFD